MPIDGAMLEAAWQQVLEHWDDDAAHRRFLELSRLAGRLPEAGRRYRAIKDRDPERRERAEAAIEQLLGLAMQDMRATKTPPRTGRGPLLWMATLAISMALLYLVSTLLRGL